MNTVKISRDHSLTYEIMDKQTIYSFLKSKKIAFEVTEHAAVFNMQELSGIELPYPEDDAKNLFVRDDKKRQFFLITVKGDKRVDLKALRKTLCTRPLSFASDEVLKEKLQLTPGSVTPLGLLNNHDCDVCWILDKDFEGKPHRIGVHPNDNTATVWLRPEDLANLISEHGNPVILLPL